MPAWGPFELGGTRVAPGESADIRLHVSESYIAEAVAIPVTVVRGARRGPALFLTASIHGDELNGVGIVRDLLNDAPWADLCGTLIAVPVANVPAFLNQDRRLPDRRDLNRAFPGSRRGSLTARLAHALFANRLMVNSAHVTQFGERAVDTFYVTDLLGGKVTGKERLRQIEQALLAAAGEPAEPVAA